MSKLSGNRLKIVIVIAAVLFVLISGAIVMYIVGIGAVDSKDNEDIVVTIPSGTGGIAVIDILDENGLIKNKTCAKIHVRIGRYDSLQANTYVFRKSMPLTDIMDAVNTGDPKYLEQMRFTVIEGATIPDAAEALSKVIPFTKDEILAVWSDREYLKQLIDEYWFLTDDILQDDILFPLEGYIYPETYFVADNGDTIQNVTETVLRKTDEVLTERKKKIEQSGYSIHQFLTLASIVENESLFDEDKPMIAGVFINRLKANMALQSDITVLYALQEKRVDVTYSDLEVDSKYNTYKNPGLPIGPVCAVAETTMDDLLNYKKSDYLYFFAKKNGDVIYSKTLSEHEKVVEENRWY